MEGNNKKSVSYQKETVCEVCMSIGIEYLDCVCTYMKNYPTITVEFEVCNCCGRVNDSDIPDTPFNREVMGHEYFYECRSDYELRQKIDSFTYQIDSFRTSNQVNKGESAVRVTCIETGKVVECSKHRSRYQNIEQAKRMLNEH